MATERSSTSAAGFPPEEKFSNATIGTAGSQASDFAPKMFMKKMLQGPKVKAAPKQQLTKVLAAVLLA